MKVLLFPTCLVDHIKPKVGVDTVRLLKFFGVDVEVPEQPSCCGQIAFNVGYWRQAREMALSWLDVYDKEGFDYIVAPSGSCVHMVRENFPLLFENEPEILERVQRIRKKIFEIVEFLTQILKVQEIPSRFRGTVTYHASCHYLRGLGVKEPPKSFLLKISGAKFVPMALEETCCGFGGLFSVKFPYVSYRMAERKVKSIQETGAEYLTSSDLSCLMNLGGVLSRLGVNVKPIHIVEILAEGLDDGKD